MASKRKTPPRAKTKGRGNRVRLRWRRLVWMAAVGALSATAALGLVAGLVWTGLRVASSDYFRLREIRVEPGRHHTSEEILARIDFPIGVSLLTLDTSALATELGGFPWVREARVRKRFPGVLEIELVERTPVLLAALPEGLWFVDEDGAAIAAAESDDPLDLPVVTGATDRDMGAARPFAGEVKTLREVDSSPLGRGLEEIHVDERGGRTLVFAEGAVRARVGRELDAPRLARLERVLADLEGRGERAARIELDFADSAVVSLRADGAAAASAGGVQGG